MNTLVKYCLVIALLGTGATAFGQAFRPSGRPPFRTNNVPNRTRYVSKIQAAKETYLNMQLQLTQDEADRFWPVYRDYDKELTSIRSKKRANLLNTQTNSSEQLKMELYYEEQLVEIHRHYTAEFLKILPPQKVSLIYKSERQFNDELIRQMNERKPGQHPAAAPANK